MDVDSQHNQENAISWVGQTVSTLAEVRAALWPILEPLGTVYTTGAFYFLVPVPPKVGLKSVHAFLESHVLVRVQFR